MSINNTILLVEDSISNAMVYQSYLEPQFSVDIADSGTLALRKFRENIFDLIILDVQLPDINGLDVLKKIRQSNPDIPVIVITAHSSANVATEAMQLGANDFVTKPFDKARINVTINNLLKGIELSCLVKQYESMVKQDSFEGMIGNSLAMQNIYHIIQSAAPSKATVFITGESGTGKELCAEAIHACSPRRSESFVALNCAAIPHDLIESEIFGHIKGAFTGASDARKGAAAKANRGTLFLDEIGEMPLALQSKLLRFIQTGRFQPVGSSKEIATDIRFVCATNRDPLREVRAGRFREDLYYRLNVIPIHMPALRERSKDSLLIANSLLTEVSEEEGKGFIGFDNQVKDILLSYPWPGNVRELSNIIRNIVVLNNGDYISTNMLPQPLLEFVQSGQPANIIQSSNNKQKTTASDLDQQMNAVNLGQEVEHHSNDSQYLSQDNIKPLWLAEKDYIESIIAHCDGSITRAAALLDISPSTIYRKKQQWEGAVT